MPLPNPYTGKTVHAVGVAAVKPVNLPYGARAVRWKLRIHITAPACPGAFRIYTWHCMTVDIMPPVTKLQTRKGIRTIIKF